MKQEFTTKCITIRKDQNEFLKQERQKGNRFKLAKFVQVKLDDWIEFRKNGEEFIENCKKIE